MVLPVRLRSICGHVVASADAAAVETLVETELIVKAVSGTPPHPPRLLLPLLLLLPAGSGTSHAEPPQGWRARSGRT